MGELIGLIVGIGGLAGGGVVQGETVAGAVVAVGDIAVAADVLGREPVYGIVGIIGGKGAVLGQLGNVAGGVKALAIELEGPAVYSVHTPGSSLRCPG